MRSPDVIQTAASGAMTPRANSPTLSVAAIIPLYNGAPFIEDALRSVLAQTEPADEIVVVDDGSTDEGPEIVKRMALQHPIRLLSKPNGGQGSARNLGIAECSSSHIALLDQDDLWYPDHLAALKRPFLRSKHSDLALVYANLDQIDRAGRMVQRQCLNGMPTPHPKTSRLDCLRHDMFILPGASLFTRTAFDDVGRFDERLSGYEDDDLWVRMFSAGYRMTYLKTAVTKWRIYPGSTSFSVRMARSRMIYFRKLIEAYPDEPRLNLYWGRDVLAPRFFRMVHDDFSQGSRLKDHARVSQALLDMKEIIPFMKRNRRMRRYWPLSQGLRRIGLNGAARSLMKRAVRDS